MKLTWTTFTGIRPKLDIRLLPDGNAQIADNINTEHGGLQSIEGTLDIVALAKTGVQSIYRFGQALNSATQFWFHWTTPVDVVKGPIANDTSERTYWTGEGAPKYTTAQLGTTGANLPSASRPLGVPAPTTAPLLAATGAPDAGAGSETRVVVYTFVTDDGQESAPSPPATGDIIVGQGQVISGMETAASNGAVLATKRIYRSQRGTYLFVAEIPATDTTYTDILPSDSLGEVLGTLGWDVPSATLSALKGGPNGMMAGVDGYTVNFCEPFYPHAWPLKYSQTVDYPCVGLGQFGQTFVVLTTGLPYLMDGVHPANISVAPAKFYQPCVSKESIVSTGGDVIWASPDGLVSVGSSGQVVLTDQIFTPKQWRALKPETLIGAWHEGWYVGTYNPGTGIVGFMFRPATNEWVSLPGLTATAMYRDTVGDALYLCIGDRIHQFRGGDLLAKTWKSQVVTTPLMSFVVARVTGEYPVQFRLYKDGLLALDKTVASDEPFKLPDKLASNWEVELAGTPAVLGVAIGTNEGEI